MASVLITGGAKRLGHATVRKFHQKGFNVHLHYQHSAVEAKTLAAELNLIRPDSVQLHQADLDSEVQIQQLGFNICQIDPELSVVVNNASTFFATAIETNTVDQWQQLVNINLKAPYFLIQSVLPTLQKNNGAVINLIDIHAIRPLAGHGIYSMTKSGLQALTKSLALDLAPNIRVNGVAPGAILWPDESTDQDQKQKLSKIPLQRTGNPADIADAIWFLSQAEYITGQILAVDGGRTLNQ